MDYRYRFLSTRLGRFIQPDPVIPELENPQSFNRYAYVENNPIVYFDPNGHEKVILIYGSYEDTNSFMAAAATMYQQLLDEGYKEEDILMVQADTDDDVFEAIAGSDVGEIEQIHIFSHGWEGGLQLSSGDEKSKQLTLGDIDPEVADLGDRFADLAEIHIKACQVGDGRFPKVLADTWGLDVFAHTLSLKFYQVYFDFFIVEYDGGGEYDPEDEVVMLPYVFGVAVVPVPAEKFEPTLE